MDMAVDDHQECLNQALLTRLAHWSLKVRLWLIEGRAHCMVGDMFLSMVLGGNKIPRQVQLGVPLMFRMSGVGISRSNLCPQTLFSLK